MQNDECKIGFPRRGWLTVSLCVLQSAFCVAFPGCASDKKAPTTRPATVRERQDKALKDPFNYSPDADKTDISGGGLSDFDRDAFNRDVKHVLDP